MSPTTEQRAIERAMSKLSRRWRRLRQAVHERAGAVYELDGCRFELPPWADDVKRNIRRGNYEGPERRLVAKWLDGKRTVIELGGAFGIVSGVIGARLGDDTPHIIVEANPALVAFCRRNAAAGRPAGAPVTAIAAAIAYGAEGDVAFLASDAFLGSRLAHGDEAGAVRVPATTLREVLKDHSVDAFDLVCDIEAAEWDLVKEDAAALARCHLAIIELHPDAFAESGASERGFVDMLAAAGLDIVDRESNVIAARNRAFAN
jgi:FkbM family methyltransferase